MFSETLFNCYDSHVHWLATGQMKYRLDLSQLKSQEDIKSLKIDPHFFQGDWLLGFGWDQSLWEQKQFPDKKILDQLFPETPVSFSRADGHATWCNTEALKRIGLADAKGRTQNPLPEIQGGKIELDSEGQATGILIDSAERLIDQVLPVPDQNQIRRYLMQGMQIFNRAGITHIRDLTCTPEQWASVVHLDKSGLLTLAVEEFFGAYEPKDFLPMLQAAIEAKKDKLKRVRVMGVKVFFDGALGSEGALLSQCYCRTQNKGLSILTEAELKDMMLQTWTAGLALAVHVIGDEAADRVSTVACELWDQGQTGQLHLEHVEMLRTETIKKLQGRQVICHLQPCHWHTDKRWLKEKLGGLYQFVFPWRALQEANIPFFFGSDSPIEEPSLLSNLKALEDSALNSIPKLLGSFTNYHQHPDKAWVANTHTHFSNGEVSQVVFDGEHLF